MPRYMNASTGQGNVRKLKDAEKTMAYIARVSNPSNQKNEDYSKLLSYSLYHISIHLNVDPIFYIFP